MGTEEKKGIKYRVKQALIVFLMLIVLLVLCIVFYNLPQTDKLITKIYTLRYENKVEYRGEREEIERGFFARRVRIKTYYDAKEDLEFHLYFRDELRKNKITSDDYYQCKLRREAKKVLSEEILEPLLENDYYIVSSERTCEGADKRSKLKEMRVDFDIYTWAENDYDNIAETVHDRFLNEEKWGEKKGMAIYIVDNERSYNEVKEKLILAENIRYDMVGDVEQEEAYRYEALIYCYDSYGKWIDGYGRTGRE